MKKMENEFYIEPGDRVQMTVTVSDATGQDTRLMTADVVFGKIDIKMNVDAMEGAELEILPLLAMTARMLIDNNPEASTAHYANTSCVH